MLTLVIFSLYYIIERTVLLKKKSNIYQLLFGNELVLKYLLDFKTHMRYIYIILF